MPKPLVLALATLALALGLWLALRGRPDSGPSAEPAVAPSATGGVAPSSPAQPAPIQPAAGEVASSAAASSDAGAAPQPSDAAADAPGGQKSGPDRFAERYAGRSRPELVAARDALARRIDSDRELLLRERLAAGKVVVVRPGGPTFELPKDASGRQAASMGTTATAFDGATEMQLAWLPFEEYGDFYAALDELEWLKGQTR